MIEGSPMLSHEALYVLKQKRSRHLGGQRGDDVLNDEPTSRRVVHPQARTHGGEGLARKTRNIKVMVWKLFRAPTGNVLEKLAGPGVTCVTKANDTATKRINFASGDHLVPAG
jgi:hypothetical protein